MARVFRDNGLTLALMLMFSLSVLGQALSGWGVENEELRRHGGAMIGFLAYLRCAAFLSSLFENWESEFLQMGIFVVLTAVLHQRGAEESQDPDKPPRDILPSDDPEAPAGARRTDVLGWLYAHSLGIALGLLFLASFLMHWTFSARAAAAEAQLYGEPAKSTLAYLGDAQLWFESFQNWQSEFLSTAVLTVLSIFLRYKNSPMSKPLASPNSRTGGE